MKKLYTVAFVFMVLLSMTMSASALVSKTITRQNGNSAFASWSDGASSTFLGVFENNDGTDIFVSICTPGICKSGFTFTQQDVLNADRRLTTATLTPVQVVLFDFSTGTSETITIQAEWTGVGDLIKSSSHSISKFGDFMFKFSGSSTFREAEATGSVNGQDIGTSVFAEISTFKVATMTMQK